MYIYRIVIENFRNFQSFSWKPNPKINVIFGPNGCGKTNLAVALSMVFSAASYESFFEPSDYYQGNTNARIKIQVWLTEIEALETNYSEYLQYIDSEDNYACEDAQADLKRVLIYQLESGENRRMEWRFFQTTQQPLCSSTARKAVRFAYIDAERQPQKEVGLQTRSLFYRMAKDDIGAEVERISSEIVLDAKRKIGESQVISTYMTTLKDLGELSQIEKFDILLKNPESTWSYSGYELGTSAGNAQLSFSRQSKGIQNLFLLLLMKKQLSSSGIVFIEELEQNLEPKYQRYIADEYKRLPVGQLFITSHSPDVISHFSFDSISSLSSSEAEPLLSGLHGAALKEIYRMNKKEFLSALMAQAVILVEGDSEKEAFPVFSYGCNLALSKNNVELLSVGGKTVFKTYCEVLKHFGKTVYVVVDHDSDVTSTLNVLTNIADAIFVSMDSYEDLILPYADYFIPELDNLLEFSIVKDKLLDIEGYDSTKSKKVDRKKLTLCHQMKSLGISISSLTSYKDIQSYPCILKYVMHDSFASAYYARAVANAIVDKGTNPVFFERIVNHINNKASGLVSYESYSNIFAVRGE